MTFLYRLVVSLYIALPQSLGSFKSLQLSKQMPGARWSNIAPREMLAVFLLKAPRTSNEKCFVPQIWVYVVFAIILVILLQR